MESNPLIAQIIMLLAAIGFLYIIYRFVSSFTNKKAKKQAYKRTRQFSRQQLEVIERRRK